MLHRNKHLFHVGEKVSVPYVDDYVRDVEYNRYGKKNFHMVLATMKEEPSGEQVSLVLEGAKTISGKDWINKAIVQSISPRDFRTGDVLVCTNTSCGLLKYGRYYTVVDTKKETRDPRNPFDNYHYVKVFSEKTKSTEWFLANLFRQHMNREDVINSQR